MTPGRQERWFGLADRLGIARPQLAWFVIEASHGFPERFYHTLDHVASCLALLDEHRDLAHEPDTIELALWFHDAIYLAGTGESETMSAELLRMTCAHCNAPGPVIDCAERLILATRHTGEPLTGDEALICDIDLASLAIDPDEYTQTALSVRREFSALDDAMYAAGRRRFLEGMLGRERIYANERFASRYESGARANMARELALLGQR